MNEEVRLHTYCIFKGEVVLMVVGSEFPLLFCKNKTHKLDFGVCTNIVDSFSGLESFICRRTLQYRWISGNEGPSDELVNSWSALPLVTLNHADIQASSATASLCPNDMIVGSQFRLQVYRNILIIRPFVQSNNWCNTREAGCQSHCSRQKRT